MATRALHSEGEGFPATEAACQLMTEVGADVALRAGPWSLNLVGRFLDSSLDLTTGEERAVRQLDFDSLNRGVGFGYRF